MKKRFIILTLILVLCFVFIDQVIKIIIADYFLEDMICSTCGHIHYERVTLIDNVLYFHPYINTNLAITTVNFASRFNIDISDVSPTPVFITIFCLLVFGIILPFSLYSIYISKKYKRLVYAFFSFIIAGITCSWIDKVFWSGSLDYIGLFDWFIFDLKDVYITICVPLIILWYILYLRDYIKLNKEERKQEKKETKMLNWIKKGCPLER